MERLLFFGQNVNGLRTKAAEFKCNTLSVDADVYMITETNLFDGMRDSEVFDLSQYNVFRRDRECTSCSNDKKSGGGVLVAVRQKLSAVRRTLFQSEAEDIWITVFNEDSRRSPHLLCLFTSEK